MRDHHSQVFTVFGGAYVPESRSDRFPRESKKGSAGKVTALLGVLVIGFTTAAAATAKAGTTCVRNTRFQCSRCPHLSQKLPGI